MKRNTRWPHAWLGLTFNWGALMGFAAQTGTLDTAALFLYGGLFFWTLGYDTIYALQDLEDDALIGVKSTARLFGSRVKEFVLGFYAIAFTLVLAAGLAEHAGWPLILLMTVAGGHLLWQVHRLEPDNPANALRLFRANRETGALFAISLAIATWFG
jgi:4-hydroxybenzoate polyprenyltransferase